MKNLLAYIFILASLIITGCARDVMDYENDEPVNTQDSIKAEEATDGGVYVSLPDLIDGNAVNESTVVSRSTLVYDNTAKKMLFSWGEDNSEAYTCIFTLNDNVQESPYDEVTPQIYTRRADQDATAMKCAFVGPNGIRALPPKDKDGKTIQYISFRPYPEKTKDFNYLKKDISYEGQCNCKNVNMKAFFTNTDNYAAYKASEEEASSHVGAYDYLVSEPTTAANDSNVNFALKRVGAIARFYIKCPAAEVFEKLQLVSQNTELFTLAGTMDLSSMAVSGDNQSINITPTKQSNVITLSYDYDANDATNHPGLDMTDTNSDYYYNNVGYIVSYMMIPPVDLSAAVPSESTNTVYLYLVSHTTADPTVKKYYKSANLSTPKLTSNMLYKWTSAKTNTPEPITFQEITVQQWKDEISVDNSDNGTGTIGW